MLNYNKKFESEKFDMKSIVINRRGQGWLRKKLIEQDACLAKPSIPHVLGTGGTTDKRIYQYKNAFTHAFPENYGKPHTQNIYSVNPNINISSNINSNIISSVTSNINKEPVELPKSILLKNEVVLNNLLNKKRDYEDLSDNESNNENKVDPTDILHNKLIK